MPYNLLQNLEYCRVIVEEFSGLLYYSHIPTAATALLIGIFVFWKNRDSLLATLLLIISILFASWNILDLLIWMNYANGDMVMAAWAPIEFISVLTFVFCLYFVYVFTDKKDVSLTKKLIWVALLLPMVVALPTAFNLESYDIQECIAREYSYYQEYYRALKLLFSGWIVFALLHKYVVSTKESKSQILFLGAGMLVFLWSFFISGYISDTTFDYRYEMYGLFAMVAFLAALAYLIVRFKAFTLKLFGAQVLVVALIILIGSQFAFIRTNTNRILTSVTLVATGFIGINLIRSVKKEIRAREEIERLAGQLQDANEHQTSLIHFITHQVKSFLTKSRYIFGELDAGSYGVLQPKVKEVVKQGYQFNTDGVNMVQNVLRAANIKTGKVTYEKKPLDFRKLVEDEVGRQRKVAEEKGLTLTLRADEGDYAFVGDADQLAHAVQNLVDNAIKYTPKGIVEVALRTVDHALRLSVKDSGIGIGEKDKEHIFTEGGRGENSQKINADSTGYGLYIVKGIVEAHGGKVWFESKGDGTSTTFFIELPVSGAGR